MKKIFLALAAVSSLAGASAFAETGYIGGAVGQSHFNADCSGTTDCKTNDTGYKLFGGYKFSPNLAGEVNYFDFGKADVRATGDERRASDRRAQRGQRGAKARPCAGVENVRPQAPCHRGARMRSGVEREPREQIARRAAARRLDPLPVELELEPTEHPYPQHGRSSVIAAASG